MAARINVFENKWYRKILNVHWSDHRTNESVYSELSVKPSVLLGFVKTQKLKYFGHKSRHESLEILLLQGRVEGRRTRGRPRRKWTNDISDCLGMSVGEATRLVEDRTGYRRRVWTATSPGIND